MDYETFAKHIKNIFEFVIGQRHLESAVDIDKFYLNMMQDPYGDITLECERIIRLADIKHVDDINPGRCAIILTEKTADRIEAISTLYIESKKQHINDYCRKVGQPLYYD